MRPEIRFRVAQTRRAIVATTALLALTAAYALNPGLVLASCNPNRGHDSLARYTATIATVSSLDGVSAYITEYDPYYSGSNPTGTNASMMLLHYTPTEQWAQIGWLKSKLHTGSMTRETFVEFYVDASHNYYQWFGSKAVGHATEYRINWVSPNEFLFLADTVQLTTFFQSWTPTQYQMFGETHDFADQMPGGTTNKDAMTGALYYTEPNHSAHTMDSGIQFAAPYGMSHPNPGQYFIWDSACS